MSTVVVLMDATAKAKWQGRRCYPNNLSHTKDILGRLFGEFGVTFPADITKERLEAIVAQMQAEGLKPATINKKLNCLSAMGIDVTGCRVRLGRDLKWWLKPADQQRLADYLRHQPFATSVAARELSCLGNLIDFICLTGLRVEEALRLETGHLDIHCEQTTMPLSGPLASGPLVGSMTVPGTKTASAQVTLPLSTAAIAVLARAIATRHSARLFPLTYDRAKFLWATVCRPFLGVSHRDEHTATLKALRRSAARYLHIELGMPLDMVRDYLRHEDIETTMGYLRLTGGYGTEEMRKWLK